MEEEDRPALSERPSNVEVKIPQGSKLPSLTPRSRLPMPGSKMPVPKRKAESPDEQEVGAGSLAQPQLSSKSQGPAKRAKTGANTSFDGGKATIAKPVLKRSLSSSAINKVGAPKTSVTTRKAAAPAMTMGRPSAIGITGRPSAIGTTGRPSSIGTRKPPAAAGGRPPAARPPTGARPTTARNTAKAAPPTAAGGGKKRAAWDLKGRLADMEEKMTSHLSQNSQLQDQIATNNDRIALLESLNQQLKGTVQVKEQETTSASNQIADLQNKLRTAESELSSARRRHEDELTSARRRWDAEMDALRRTTHQQVADLEFSVQTLERQRTALQDELASRQAEIAGLKTSVAQLTAATEGTKAALEAAKLSLAASEEDARQKAATIDRLTAVINQQEATIASQEDALRQHELTRRRLHNTIQELKGNIRVFCRVRPLIGDETLGHDAISHLHFSDDDPKVMELEKLDGCADPNMSVTNQKRSGSDRFEFSFDRVFQPTHSQEEVFEEICQLVQSALDGYNVCIFAYGQTGSGKTYTMEGPAAPTPQTEGMIPRAVQHIFQSVTLLQDKGWKYEFSACFLEIYNETIRDLLGEGRDDLKHEVKMVAAKSSEVFVTGITTVPVTDAKQVHQLLEKASQNRAVAATKCNDRSSRSHSVFQLKIAGRNTVTADTCSGILNLIDLAGSERLKDSGSSGARLKETQAINRSLAELGNVIMALANKDAHIPYRNSKLTHLLQNSLGGNSKTLMFVNVSPREDCFHETLNSLRFATKVNNCNIGTATQRKK